MISHCLKGDVFVQQSKPSIQILPHENQPSDTLSNTALNKIHPFNCKLIQPYTHKPRGYVVTYCLLNNSTCRWPMISAQVTKLKFCSNVNREQSWQQAQVSVSVHWAAKRSIMTVVTGYGCCAQCSLMCPLCCWSKRSRHHLTWTEGLPLVYFLLVTHACIIRLLSPSRTRWGWNTLF